MQSPLQRQLFLEEGLLSSIISGLLLLPEIRMMFAMVLHVEVCAKGRLEVIGADCVTSLRSELLLVYELHAEEALGGHDCSAT